jgi:hypothetical protein
MTSRIKFNPSLDRWERPASFPEGDFQPGRLEQGPEEKFTPRGLSILISIDASTFLLNPRQHIFTFINQFSQYF